MKARIRVSLNEKESAYMHAFLELFRRTTPAAKDTSLEGFTKFALLHTAEELIGDYYKARGDVKKTEEQGSSPHAPTLLQELSGDGNNSTSSPFWESEVRNALIYAIRHSFELGEQEARYYFWDAENDYDPQWDNLCTALNKDPYFDGLRFEVRDDYWGYHMHIAHSKKGDEDNATIEG